MLIVAVICYCFWFAVSQDCSSIQYPNLRDLIANGFEQQSTHVLIPQAKFSGCGTITSCSIIASCSRGRSSLHFILIQIWRKVTQDQYTLVQSVNATLPNGCVQGVVTFDNLGLSFRSDSILGVYVVTSTKPFIQLGFGNTDNSISGDLTEYYTRSIQTSPTVANLNQYTLRRRTAGISVEVIECGICANTNNNDGANTNNNDGAGIALGIIIPLAFLVGLTVTVVIVVICLKRRCYEFRVSSSSSNEVRGMQGSPYEVPERFPIVKRAGPYDVPIKNSVLCDSSESAVYAVAGMNVDNHIYWAPGTSEKEIYGQLARFHREIAREDIKLSRKIGQGAFGLVYKAELNSSQGSMEVAVKQVKKNSSEEERVKLLQEAAILGQFKHKHITSLLGVVTADQPVLVVMELLQGGSLLAFLRDTWKRKDKRSDPGLPRVLLRFSRQVAEGLAYLARKSFVHRDIAARNVLLDGDLNCKISDFGMTRELQEETYYVIKHKGAIPVKWTAPEAIFYKKYSTSSDIWSFGMLMYEMWSLGHAPFEEMSAEKVVRRLRDPHCHLPPPGCPRAVYNIMVKCWAPAHSKRPSAHELVNIHFAVNDVSLLAWSEEDKSTSQQADVLGAPLAEGAQLYLDLQHLYV